MIEKAEAQIRWQRSSHEVSCHVRAMCPAPGAFTTLPASFCGDSAARKVKLFSPRVVAGKGAPGEVLGARRALHIATGDGAIAFDEVQFPGKRRMAAADALRGRDLPLGTVLGAHD